MAAGAGLKDATAGSVLSALLYECSVPATQTGQDTAEGSLEIRELQHWRRWHRREARRVPAIWYPAGVQKEG